MLDIKHLNLRNEEEIISSWLDKNKVVVSVVCTTYNHELYIEDAIKGFLMQETDFAIEIIIHDDASTDNTAHTIRKYQSRYPKIIKPIYQEENQYSKGDFKPGLYTASFAKGDFIALCEGDDYWTSKLKLSEQVKVFEAFPEITICFHPAQEIDILTNKTRTVCDYFSENGFVDTKNLILGRGGYMPSASLLFKKNNTFYTKHMPSDAPIVDFFLQTYMGLVGRCYYINKAHCVYRRNHPGSWTGSMQSVEVQESFSLRMLTSIDEFYKFANKYENSHYLHDVYCFYALSYIRLSSSFLQKINRLFFVIKLPAELNKFNLLSCIIPTLGMKLVKILGIKRQ